MADQSVVLIDAMVAISTSTAAASFDGENNVSNSVISVRVNRSLEELEDTVMGEKTKSRKAGLDDVMVDIEFIQSFSTGAKQENIDLLLDEALTQSQSGKSLGLAIRPTTAIQGATNPTYAGQFALFSHSPIDGAVGEILKTTAQFKAAGGNMQRLVTAS